MRVLVHGIKKYATFQSFRKYRDIDELYLPNPANLKDVIALIKQQKTKQIKWSLKSYAVMKDWMIKCAPHLCSKARQLFEKDAMGDLFYCLNKMKLDRREFFDMAEKELNTELKLLQVSFNNLSDIYGCIVNFKRKDSKRLIQRLRNNLIQQIMKTDKITEKNAINFFFLLQNIILDINLNKSSKNAIIKEMSTIINGSINQLRNIGDKGVNKIIISRLYELLKVYQIEVGENILKLFQSTNEKIDQFFKLARQENCPDFVFDNAEKKYALSTFQKIFLKRLKELGYDFDSNVLIRGNEYDFIVKGKLKQKYFPLANIDIFNCNAASMPAISIQKVREIAQSSDLEFVECKTTYQEPVVLNLNGPQHYIDSDTLPKGTIPRIEEFQYEKLLLYDIKKYNIINSVDWQKVDRYEKTTENLINDKIMNPTIIKIMDS